MLSRLRMLPREVYLALPDADEGLGNALYHAAHEEATLSAVLAAAKSRRYALSRLRRMTMCAALGVASGMAEGTPPYARVLAANERGRGLLREMNERSAVPIVTKPAAARTLPEPVRGVFAHTADAHDLYVLAYTAREERRCGGDWRRSPTMVSF